MAKRFYNVTIKHEVTVWAEDASESYEVIRKNLLDIIGSEEADIWPSPTKDPLYGDDDVPWGSPDHKTVGELKQTLESSDE